MKNETITGKEVRYILRQNRVNLRQLADAIRRIIDNLQQSPPSAP